MTTSIGAVGDKGLDAEDLRTKCSARGLGKKRSLLREVRLVAVVVGVLLVSVFAIVLVQGHTPSTALKSRPYTLDYLLWTAEGDREWDVFGFSVSSAGDVNKDGYDDIVVGAPGYENGEINEGCACLYLGSSIGIPATPSWTSEGDKDYAAFGISVSSAGDVNGDGYGDVVIGARTYDNDQYREGRAFLYLGSSTGLPATPSWIAESDQEWAQFGSSVSCAGDVNNDGYDDVIIGAPFYDNDTYNDIEGAAFLYVGSSTGLSAAPSWTAYGGLDWAWFGSSVSSAGDVNGDGFDDVLVGAPSYYSGESNEGRANLYLGSSTGLSASPSWTADGDQVEAFLGLSVSSAGDVNNDGYYDVVVGAPGYDQGPIKGGLSYLFLGSSTGLSAKPSWIADGGQEGARFGGSVSSAGDVDSDGFDDVIVGASDYDNDQTDEGRAYLYLGSFTGLSESSSWTAEGDETNASYGRSVSSAGDVNGDGFDEVIVGASGYDNNGQIAGAGHGRAYIYGEILIPEFNVILIPVIGAVAIVVALRRIQRRGPSD